MPYFLIFTITQQRKYGNQSKLTATKPDKLIKVALIKSFFKRDSYRKLPYIMKELVHNTLLAQKARCLFQYRSKLAKIQEIKNTKYGHKHSTEESVLFLTKNSKKLSGWCMHPLAKILLIIFPVTLVNGAN